MLVDAKRVINVIVLFSSSYIDLVSTSNLATAADLPGGAWTERRAPGELSLKMKHNITPLNWILIFVYYNMHERKHFIFTYVNKP